METRATLAHGGHNAHMQRMPATNADGPTRAHHGVEIPAVVPLRVVLHGARGRMGQRIAACAPQTPGCSIVAALDRDDALPAEGTTADVVIDFSSDAGAVRAAALAERLGCALLVGTTGLSPDAVGAIERAARRVPAMVAPNTSLGVAVTRRLVAEAARLLAGWDVDIVETHHARKVDAPSGTARSLAEAVARGRGKPLESCRIHAIRAGDVVGEHAVTWSGAGERVTVAHVATSRDLFALGAVRMAAWLVRQRPGMHAPDAWYEDFARAGG
jgi:4-hydroxy-tetrahydrodipicolinate reductase